MIQKVFKQYYDQTRTDREAINGHKGHVFWISGLSGSGKSTLANGLAGELLEDGHHTYTLDGDNIRVGINNDLGFDQASRTENNRRISEVAKLMCDAGLAVICCFISPLESDRQMAKDIIGSDDFSLVFADCPIKVCIERDVKGLYKRALSGEIKDFTGISSPYEKPLDPDIHIHSDTEEPADSVDKIVEYAKKILKL